MTVDRRQLAGMQYKKKLLISYHTEFIRHKMEIPILLNYFGENMAFHMIKISIFIISILMLQACATYKTVVPNSQKKLVQYVKSIDDEKCVTIPRVYSGIFYTFCVMCVNTKLTSSHTDVVTLPFDFLADTILLPYTIIRQFIDGNLVLKKERKSQ